MDSGLELSESLRCAGAFKEARNHSGGRRIFTFWMQQSGGKDHHFGV
jgi:hypothetical protein